MSAYWVAVWLARVIIVGIATWACLLFALPNTVRPMVMAVGWVVLLALTLSFRTLLGRLGIPIERGRGPRRQMRQLYRDAFWLRRR
jgi:ABC-type spermidine/putrescine transport system permease subunit I